MVSCLVLLEVDLDLSMEVVVDLMVQLRLARRCRPCDVSLAVDHVPGIRQLASVMRLVADLPKSLPFVVIFLLLMPVLHHLRLWEAVVVQCSDSWLVSCRHGGLLELKDLVLSDLEHFLRLLLSVQDCGFEFWQALLCLD